MWALSLWFSFVKTKGNWGEKVVSAKRVEPSNSLCENLDLINEPLRFFVGIEPLEFVVKTKGYCIGNNNFG